MWNSRSILLLLPGILLGCEPKTYDQDGDGLTLAVDCDDGDTEVGGRETRYVDADSDGQGTSDTATPTIESCTTPDGYADVVGDCDDQDAEVRSGKDEICEDGRFNDCGADATATAEVCLLSGTWDVADWVASNGGAVIWGPSGELDWSGTIGGAVALYENGLLVSAPDESTPAIATVEATWDHALSLSASGDWWLGDEGDRGGAALGVRVDEGDEGDETLTVLIGAPGAKNPAGTDPDAEVGAVFLADGRRTGGGYGAATRVAWGEQDGDEAGASLATGDLDGDGLDELIMGAPGAAEEAGAAAVFWGSDGPWEAATWSAALQDGVILTGENAGDRLGHAVLAADVHGDGLADLLVGAPGSDTGGAESGQITMIKGDTSLSGAAAGSLDPTYADGDADEELGWAMAAALADGNESADLLVGGPGLDDNSLGGDVGRVTLVRGGSDALDTWAANQGQWRTWRGAAAGDRLGSAVAWGPDLDGDGTLDPLLGAPGADGAAGVGTGAVFAAPNSDGGGNQYVDNVALFTLYGSETSAGLGTSLATGTELDGDGLVELAVGAPGATAEGDGAVWLLRASAW